MRKASQQPPAAEIEAEAGTPAAEPSGREMMKAVLAKPTQIGEKRSPEADRISGIVIGELLGLNEGQQALVTFPGCPGDKPLAALSTAAISESDPGREVALSFVGGDPSCPVILGFIQTSGEQAKVNQAEVEVDKERLVLTADREIVLKCGKSSITLTRAGKIIIKGAYLSNYSTGVNRIKGGSVQIN